MNTNEMFETWKLRAIDDPDLQVELANLISEDDIHDRFYRELQFGTGGLRGEIGVGTNRMNIYTVRKATQGLASYVNNIGKTKTAAIAYDSRIGSEFFAKTAAEVFAANGIITYIYPRLTPTPALSFAVRELGCDVGICITASHNPAKYNGYKVYGPDGCQITTVAATEIQSYIKHVNIFNDILTKDFDEALKSDNIRYIKEGVLNSYIDAVLNERIYEPGTSIKIVYTPLNGAGLECVTKVLNKAGFNDISIVKEQRMPDGTFPTCPYPNPEIKEAMRLGLKLCADIGADILLATDPDCDRVGIAAKQGEGYSLMTGNEVGILLLDYVCQLRIKQKKMPARPLAVKTIVTTSMVLRIAQVYGVEVIDVLTGFKFIGEQIGILEKNNEKSRYILGFEESYGFLSGTYVRDKDAVNASLLICDMAAWCKSQGVTLPDALEALYKKFGYFANTLDSFEFAGEKGFLTMQGFMTELRENPPSEISGLAVIEIRDYLWNSVDINDIHRLPSSDVIQMIFDNGSIITIRPSGTEPKLKIYCEALGKSKEESGEIVEMLRVEFQKILAGLNERPME